ncbi:Putative phosphatidate cytidylyltransferase [Septoria linicola]|uniref:Phosphatidate cytidylyltransferase, mitochondrial n=1 Tax=Septoria linicola TaxID=215465 RepID=A0A9Q9EJD5_9PEZI|nr:Putative phosphatidate cytidylyltransferase [Septoria linicola]
MLLQQKLAASPVFHSLLGVNSFFLANAAWQSRPSHLVPQTRSFSLAQRLRDQNEARSSLASTKSASSDATSNAGKSVRDQKTERLDEKKNAPSDATGADSTAKDSPMQSLPPGWEENADYNISNFADLPHRFFGYNQHIKINEDFKESLRQVLWQFKAPIRYAFAYGSGVFGQKSSGSSTGSESLSPHPNPPKAVEEWQKGGAKIIDFIFGVSHTQHWHSLNLQQNPHHYSGIKHMPYSSALVSWMQDGWGAGLYYNPYITVNGIMIKYGVVHLDTLAKDLTDWNTLYLAGRLQKPVKILRDDPRMRLSNQVNLISALRTALLMLPEEFTERQLYERITSLSYLGDPRMHSMIASEAPNKVSNIVGAQLPGFRQLYVPLIENLPNVNFTDSRTPREYGWEKEDAIRHTGTLTALKDVLGGQDGLTLAQDMDPQKRGNMVRRLPQEFRKKLYYQYMKKFQIPGSAFDNILKAQEDEDPSGFKRREGGDFEKRIAEQSDLAEVMSTCVQKTVAWPAAMQSVKGVFTSGLARSIKYVGEKRSKGKAKKAVTPKPEPKEEAAEEDGEGQSPAAKKREEH